MEGRMGDSLVELEQILQSEYELYSRLYELEQDKSDAILNRNGTSIESFAREQEKLLGEIAEQESRRKSALVTYQRLHHLDIGEDDITLTNLVSIEDEGSSDLLGVGRQLRTLLLKIRSLQETNQKLLQDNIEFFNALVARFKNSVSLRGYSEKGSEEFTMTESVMINRRI
jgi:flagellar biosynthesis/type III secretory pathway chaperone